MGMTSKGRWRYVVTLAYLDEPERRDRRAYVLGLNATDARQRAVRLLYGPSHGFVIHEWGEDGQAYGPVFKISGNDNKVRSVDYVRLDVEHVDRKPW